MTQRICMSAIGAKQMSMTLHRDALPGYGCATLSCGPRHSRRDGNENDIAKVRSSSAFDNIAGLSEEASSQAFLSVSRGDWDPAYP